VSLSKDVKIEIKNLTVKSEVATILKNVNLSIYKNTILGLMGPAVSGKSTLISVINRMIDFEENLRFREVSLLMEKIF
jgi:phosphate transport system ATP-binding protein